jgi:hypothetical protein
MNSGHVFWVGARAVLTLCLALPLASSALAVAADELVVGDTTGLSASDDGPGDAFGDAVAIDGSTLVVGAPFNDDPTATNSG